MEKPNLQLFGALVLRSLRAGSKLNGPLWALADLARAEIDPRLNDRQLDLWVDSGQPVFCVEATVSVEPSAPKTRVEELAQLMEQDADLSQKLKEVRDRVRDLKDTFGSIHDGSYLVLGGRAVLDLDHTDPTRPTLRYLRTEQGEAA